MMKKTLAILALISGLAVGNAAVTYNISGENITGGNTGENSLYLGFYAADEVSTRSVLINLGTSANVFREFTLDLSSASSVLSTTFEKAGQPRWFENSQVYWGLIGYDGGYGGYGHVYAGRPTIQPLLQTDVNGSTALTEDHYWSLSDQIGALTTAHTAGLAEMSTVMSAGNSAANTHQISVVDNSPVTFKGVADANFRTFTSPVYEQVISGLSIQQFAYDGVSSFPTAFDGTFGGVSQLNGVITVVPEPSTYALLGFGGLLLFIAYRRRVS